MHHFSESTSKKRSSNLFPKKALDRLEPKSDPDSVLASVASYPKLPQKSRPNWSTHMGKGGDGGVSVRLTFSSVQPPPWSLLEGTQQNFFGIYQGFPLPEQSENQRDIIIFVFKYAKFPPKPLYLPAKSDFLRSCVLFWGKSPSLLPP